MNIYNHLIFENPVYQKMFESYLRIVSIDYPKTLSKFRDFRSFFQLKKKFHRSEKNVKTFIYVFEQINKSMLAKKVRLPIFLLNKFFSLIC